RQVIMVAARGHTQIEPDSDSRFLVLQNGTRYLGQPGDMEFQVMEFGTLGQRMEAANPRPLSRKQDTLSTMELLRSSGADAEVTLSAMVLLCSTCVDAQPRMKWSGSIANLLLLSPMMAVALARCDHRCG